MNPDEVDKAIQRAVNLVGTTMGSHFHVPTRKKRRGTDISGLYSAPAVAMANVPPQKPQVGDVWTDARDGRVSVWNGYAWVIAATPVDDEDLVEVQTCHQCSTELRSEEEFKWSLCNKHKPDFDAPFTADERELYMGKHNGGAMAVGFVRRINQLELLIENLQEQIIELSKGDN